MLDFEPVSDGERERSARAEARSLDREAPFAVTLDEAYRGVEKTVTIPRDDESRTLSVTVPAGVKSGSRLRMKGEGEAGDDGRGDLYLVVEVLPHATFRREGSALLTEVPVTLPQAMLGAELSVPTMEGSVMMRIPAGTQGGTTFRLRGKGMPDLRGAGPGDELVKVNVEIPRNLSSRQKELVEELAKTLQG